MASETNLENPNLGTEGHASEAAEDIPVIPPEVIAHRIEQVRSLGTPYDENSMGIVHSHVRKQINEGDELRALQIALNYACDKAFVTGCYDGMIKASVGRFNSRTLLIFIAFLAPRYVGTVTPGRYANSAGRARHMERNIGGSALAEAMPTPHY
ncbi:hypothetical protein F5Y09DRAFT_343666 [Xylaria sp. FL1042]|nr:hypothetical protein F5Y09DRAFT_343666 [Xylaria sp. FL1042]